MEKWPFLDQNHGLTPFEKCQFYTFWTSCFYSLERPSFVLEYRKKLFYGLYCQKTQNCHNGHFRTKTKGYSLWKNLNFSTFWTFCFHSWERRFFVLEYRKRHFKGLYCQKKQSWKNGHIWTKNHGLTPLKKKSVFWLFKLLVFIA